MKSKHQEEEKKQLLQQNQEDDGLVIHPVYEDCKFV